MAFSGAPIPRDVRAAAADEPEDQGVWAESDDFLAYPGPCSCGISHLHDGELGGTIYLWSNVGAMGRDDGFDQYSRRRTATQAILGGKPVACCNGRVPVFIRTDRKSTRLNSSHL